MRASYRHAVQWIAANLDASEGLEDVAGWTVVLLVADIFGKDNLTVARAVIREQRTKLIQALASLTDPEASRDLTGFGADCCGEDDSAFRR